MKIRTASIKDLSILVRHRRRMFEDLGRPSSAADDRRYRDWARARLKSGRLVVFLAESGGRIVAGGGVWLQEHQPRPGFPGGDLPYLLSVFTEPEFRGKGLATRITRAAMRWARAHGHRRMFLHASSMGRRVYARLGWERTWEMKVDLA